jgi:hypothetical protein
MSVYCSMLKFSKVYDGLEVGKRGKGVGGGGWKGGGGWAWPTIFFLSRNRFTFSCCLSIQTKREFFLLEKNTALRAFSFLIIIPIFFSLFILSFAVQYRSRIHERTNLVEVSLLNLESSQT